MMKLIALGNRFMRDDGIAIVVAEKLYDTFTWLGIDCILAETDYQYGFYALHDTDFVILLDALDQQAEPGSMHIFKLADVLSQPSQYSTPHDMSIIERMKLHTCQHRGYLIGVQVSDVQLGDGLSDILSSQLEQICSKVEKIIQKIVMEEQNHA